MFFVDHDEPEILQRREHRAARADDDARATGMNLVPFVVAFALGQMAVQNGDCLLRLGKPAFETFDGLRRQRNFGHENNCGASAVQRCADGLQINFGLAGARDAVEQNRTCVLRSIECLRDFTLMRAFAPHSERDSTLQ